MDKTIKRCNRNIQRTCIVYRNMQRLLISKCQFVDHVPVTSDSEKHLQSSLKVWNEGLTKNGIKVNYKKKDSWVSGNM